MSTNILRQFVADTMTEEDRRQVVEDSIQFEKDGFIGDCTLRTTVSNFKEVNGIPKGDNVVMWMNLLTSEVFRFYAFKHLKIEN